MVPPYAETVTGSNRLVEARPVRNPPNSLRNTSIAPSMRRRRSFSSSSWAMSVPHASPYSLSLLAYCGLLWLFDDRIAPAPLHDLGKPAILEDREDQDRDAVFPGQRDRRGIHDLQVAGQYLVIVEPVEAAGFGVAHRIGIIDPVDLGGLEQGVAAHLGGAKGGRRVGREERVAGAGA